MKKSLLATVAAVALIAGAGFASAAEGVKDHAGGAAVRSEPEMKKGSDIKAAAPTKGRAETTGAGVESKSEMKSEMKAEPKADMKSDNKAKRPSTTGAGPAENGWAETKPGSDTRAGSDKSRSQDGKMDNKSGADTKAGADSKSNAAAGDTKSGAGGSVSLTSDQKTKIRTSMSNAPKMSRSSINFNISVGTAVPRSVHFVSVPSTLIEIHPAWRGYEYFVVDEQIIIIDPHSLRIVAILDV